MTTLFPTRWRKISALACLLMTVSISAGQTIILDLTASVGLSPGGNGGGSTPQVDLGFFTAGTQVSVSASGHGDMVNSGFQVNPDGSLYVPATGSFTEANFGSPYPTYGGGDGINHFVGGGADANITGGTNYDFAGLMSTDTTLAGIIRSGALVGTFSATPTRNDWFYIGYGGVFTIPTGGAHLYVGVNDTIGDSGDNHGTYTVTFAAVPEPATWALLFVGAAALVIARVTMGRKPMRSNLF